MTELKEVTFPDPFALGEAAVPGVYGTDRGFFIFSPSPNARITELNGSGDMLAQAALQPGDIITQPGFVLGDRLQPENLGKPVIEVGGPVFKENYKLLLSLGEMPRLTYVSNISRHEDQGEFLIKLTGRELDYFADATRLPHLSESIGAILETGIGQVESVRMASEFARALMPGGFLVAQSISPYDLAQLQVQGFETKALQLACLFRPVARPDDPSRAWLAGVFQKPTLT